MKKYRFGTRLRDRAAARSNSLWFFDDVFMRATMTTRITPSTRGRAGVWAENADAGSPLRITTNRLSGTPCRINPFKAALELQTTASHQRKTAACARDLLRDNRSPNCRWLPITTGTRAN